MDRYFAPEIKAGAAVVARESEQIVEGVGRASEQYLFSCETNRQHETSVLSKKPLIGSPRPNEAGPRRAFPRLWLSFSSRGSQVLAVAAFSIARHGRPAD